MTDRAFAEARMTVANAAFSEAARRTLAGDPNAPALVETSLREFNAARAELQAAASAASSGVEPAEDAWAAYFGWLGSHVAMTVDLMAQPFMDSERPARKLGDVFVVGDFAKDLPADRSRYVETFYKQSKVVHQVMGDLRQARETRDFERVKEILEERRSEIALANLYTAGEARLRAVNVQMRKVQASSRTAEEKRLELDRLTAMRNELARNLDQRVTQRREAAEGSR